jgi:hypothetical protein
VKVFAEYASPEDAVRAGHALIGLGHRRVETHSPFPLTGEDAHAPRGSVVTGLAAAGAGLVGLAAAYFIQWYANVASYPLNIGGRPAHAVPAFVPSSFETMCLFGVLALFVGFLAGERLPRLWQPVFEIEGFERASVDRFWIAVDIRDSQGALDRLARDLDRTPPLRIVAGVEGAP